MKDSIIINSTTIQSNPWILDFLESQRTKGIHYWKSNTVYTYNSTSFSFEEPILARQRKDPAKGYAYEIMQTSPLAKGTYGTIFRISGTISSGKANVFQFKNKDRLVKQQDASDADKEYRVSRSVDHLHVKQPQDGFMVMRALKGEPLGSFLAQHSLSTQEKIKLTKAIFKAYKEQIIDKKLIHNDINMGNIMVETHPDSTDEPYTAKMIDFGLAERVTSATLSINRDFLFLTLMLRETIWSETSNRPKHINDILNIGNT